MLLPYEECEKYYRMQWRWVAKTGKMPIEWFSSSFTGKRLVNKYGSGVMACFACIAAGNVCSKCPVIRIVNGKEAYCDTVGTPYSNWFMAICAEDRKKYALAISKQPWRPKP